jgi:S-adenosylmethionine:tRNA ribosyltransferase-isomerase
VIKPFTYELPIDRIAQRPVHPPESARMLRWQGKSREIEDLSFATLPKILTSNDVLVFNDTKVLRARIFGEVKGHEVELLLVSPLPIPGHWRCLGRPGKRLQKGAEIAVGATICGTVVEKVSGSKYVDVSFSRSDRSGTSTIAEEGELQRHGVMPIPPYIRGGKGDEEDERDYQSIFARVGGSIAAPTASLHFSSHLCEQLRANGVALEALTLHVGAASFLPLTQGEADDITPPGEEELSCDEEVWERLLGYKRSGKRIIGVGTTVVRALETLATNVEGGFLQKTSLFITPGFTFRVIDSLITNFHQPDTTHLLLVEALVGRDALLEMYGYALAGEYRFLSYGDGMFLE